MNWLNKTARQNRRDLLMYLHVFLHTVHKQLFAYFCKIFTLLYSEEQLSATEKFWHGKKQRIPVSDKMTYLCSRVNLRPTPRQQGFQSINPVVTILPVMQQSPSHLKSSLCCKGYQHKTCDYTLLRHQATNGRTQFSFIANLILRESWYKPVPAIATLTLKRFQFFWNITALQRMRWAMLNGNVK